jgi:hypothetical protein
VFGSGPDWSLGGGPVDDKTVYQELADGKSLIALEACSGPKFVVSRAGEAYAA